MDVLQQIVNALSVGSTYALLALGLAMVFSILGLINFAHGELVTIAGYTMYALHLRGLPFALQVVGAIAAGALGAVLMERVAFRPLRGARFTTLLLASFAVSVMIQSLFLIAAGPRGKGVPSPDFLAGSFDVAGVSISYLQLATTVACLLALGLLTLLLRRSIQGKAMRAAAEDFAVTRLMGISANRVIATAFAISGALAGLAAVFLVARRGSVDPGMGFNPLLKAFIATVIGGLGSLPGAVLGGFLLGAVEVGLDALLPATLLPFRDAFALLAIMVLLYVRPQGLRGAQVAVAR
jgi:branched-chain amino acid transport system permease protein